MTTFTPLPGDAAGLQNYGAKYDAIATTISEASQKLRNLSNENWSQGESIEALAEKGKKVSGDIGKAHTRYHETALAIVEFAVALADAQADANAAIADNSSGASSLGTLQYQYRILEEDRLTMLNSGATQDQIDEINDDIRRLDDRIDSAQYAVSQAAAKYNQAEQDRMDAVKAAINRINPVLEAFNDGLGDYIRSGFESVADFLAAIGKWIADVLMPILMTIIAVVLAVVVILVLAAIVIALLALLGPLGLLLGGVVGLVALFLVGYIVATVIKCTMQPTPEMTPIQLPPKSEPTAGEEAPYAGQHSQTEDLMEDAYLDSMGGADSTVIEVIKVVGEDGVVRWRVILPSTQDWEWLNGAIQGSPDPKGDQGGLNDFGSNTMLMLTPQQEAAYQRAVRQAMLDAGVGPHDPVMMVGWSQGGILAGRFAENTSDEFNVTSIFVAGAPIDGMNIPPTVDVISVQHPDDIVHQLDLTGPRPNTDNWYTITDPPATGAENHAADSYSTTADSALNNAVNGGNEQLEYVHNKQQVFYEGEETVYAYQGSE